MHIHDRVGPPVVDGSDLDAADGELCINRKLALAPTTTVDSMHSNLILQNFAASFCSQCRASTAAAAYWSVTCATVTNRLEPKTFYRPAILPNSLANGYWGGLGRTLEDESITFVLSWRPVEEAYSEGHACAME